MAITWIDPVEITPETSGSWQDVDLSAYIPTSATGVMLHFANSSTGSGYSVGFRKNGSTDDRADNLYTNSHMCCAIGVDSQQIVEIRVFSTTAIESYLVGYFEDESVFFTNATEKAPSSTNTWLDCDISGQTSDDTAIAAIWEIIQLSGLYNCGLRKNGSTDNRTQCAHRDHSGAIIGVDENEVCELYRSSTNVKFYLVGYIKSGAVFLTNATDLSLSTTGTWLDLSALPSGAYGGFIEVHSSGTYRYGLRKNGSSEEIYRRVYRHLWFFVECDEDQIIEGKIENTGADFYLVGYAIELGPDMHVNIGGAWKTVAGVWCNIGGAWKQASEVHVNIGGTWKKS